MIYDSNSRLLRLGMTKLDIDKIARLWGAERRGKLVARSGLFGALQVAADLQARLRGKPEPPKK